VITAYRAYSLYWSPGTKAEVGHQGCGSFGPQNFTAMGKKHRCADGHGSSRANVQLLNYLFSNATGSRKIIL